MVPRLLKIATFNINNINKRIANLLDWLGEASPDVVCLQELKAEDKAFPAKALERAGYGAVWVGQRTWNGVAILGKGTLPIVTRRSLPGDPADDQRRYLEAAIGGIVVASLYAPNGNPRPGPKFDYKLAWLDRLHRHAQSLLKAEVPVVLAGDYNVVPTQRDIYQTHSWDKDALVQPQSRQRYASLMKQGWTDALRAMHPDDDALFTFWHYMRNRWQRNAGLRLDHLLLSPSLSNRLKAADVDRTVRGREYASDHAPVWIELSDKLAKGRKAKTEKKGKAGACWAALNVGRIGQRFQPLIRQSAKLD